MIQYHKKSLAGILITALLSLAIGSGCFKFEESAFDSTSAGLVLPAFFIAASSISVSGTLRDRDGALVTSTALTFTSSALTSAQTRSGFGGLTPASITSNATVIDTSDAVGKFAATLRTGTHTLTFTFNSISYTITLTVNADGTSSGTSIDGSSYTSDSPVSAGSFLAVAVGNDGGCLAYSSTDLLTWQSIGLPSTLYACNIVRDVIYADGVFVAVGQDSGAMPQCYIAVSSDGINWTQKNCQPNIDTGLHAIAHGNGTFMTVGRISGGAPTIRIGDAQGANWSTAGTGLGTQAYGAAYYNGTSFFTGQLNGAANPVIHNSDAPTTTNFSVTDGVNCQLTAAGNAFQHFAGGPGLNFLAVSNDLSSTGLYYSPFTNPVCTPTTIFGASAAQARSAAYDPFNGNWVVVGNGCFGEASTSPTTWGGSGQLVDTAAGCTPSIDFHKIIFSKTRKQFLAVGVQTTNLDPFIAVSSTGLQNSWTFTQIFNATAGATPISIAIRE